MAERLSLNRRINILGIAKDGNELLELAEMLEPEIIIMDIMLKKIYGFEVMKRLKQEGNSAEIVILTKLCNNQAVEEANKFDIKYFLTKPFEPCYLEEIIIDIDNRRADESPPSEINTSNIDNGTELDRRLKDIGIRMNFRGYGYLKIAVRLINENPSIMGALTKELYPEIALLSRSTWKRVERSIRVAIEDAWENGDIESWGRYFGHNRLDSSRKPRNKEVIAFLAKEALYREQEMQYGEYARAL
ncbi:MAG: response regulator [Oscillospiraceae bacterium]|jgi:two-component system response regulator (stage 0 sporulation protein A)|nr:response regulator [Oscillospiraceae bacterium]